MSFIPKFMKTPTWALLGTGFIGSTVYMTYKNQLDNRLNHTLIEESIHLLENNEEVLQIVGAPILVESSLRNRADLGDNINNFTYFVSGPRGKLRVELAACARSLSGIGVSSKGKKAIQDLNNRPATQNNSELIDQNARVSSGGITSWFTSPKNTDQEQTTTNQNEKVLPIQDNKLNFDRLKKDSNGKVPVPSNVPEFNYNIYYIPDPSLVKNEEQIFDLADNSKPLPADSKFWNIEYMFAEVDDSVRIMVAPIPESEKSESPILYRETYSDLALEYIQRRNNRRDFRKAQTPEEQEELRKFRLRLMYKDIAYTRFYMLCGFFMIGASSYIMFRKNKRLPIANDMIHTKAKKAISDSKMIKNVLGERIFFPNQTVGAKIGNDAEFSFQALGENGYYAVANLNGTYNEKKLDWNIHQFDVNVYNAKGEIVQNIDNWGVVKE